MISDSKYLKEIYSVVNKYQNNSAVLEALSKIFQIILLRNAAIKKGGTEDISCGQYSVSIPVNSLELEKIYEYVISALDSVAPDFSE